VNDGETCRAGEGRKLKPGQPFPCYLTRCGASAKICLDTVALASNSGFSSKELGDVLRLVQAHQAQLLEAWHGFFGTGGDR
jgi:Domain of unknown function (DUF4160)